MSAARDERDVMGEVLALVGDYDGCHERVRDWEALADWEKEANPDEDPHDDRECAEDWNRRADAILAAGYVKPRTVTTVEELDALPAGSVVHSSAGTIACRFDDLLFVVFGDDRPGSPWSILALPATVLFTPAVKP